MREAWTAGATNTGNVTATVGDKLVMNWHGTPSQKDGVLTMLPKMRDRMMPDVELNGDPCSQSPGPGSSAVASFRACSFVAARVGAISPFG